MEGASPARLYATLVGGALVIGGLAGFFYDSSFEVGSSLQAHDAFGVLAVNAWHNLFHIATGALGLAVAGYAARQYALGLGALYLVVALAGIVQIGAGETDSILKLIPVNTADNVLHVVLGGLGIAAGLATPTGRPKRAKRERAKPERAKRERPKGDGPRRERSKRDRPKGEPPKPEPKSEKPKPVKPQGKPLSKEPSEKPSA